MAKNAFTLAELLIALAILGVIATFTIPKVLTSQQDGKNKAIAKEAAGMVSEAFQAQKLQGTVSGTTNIQTILSNNINYVKIDTTSTVDMYPTDSQTTRACSATELCFQLHNGAILWTFSVNFAGTNATNGVYFVLDPDGKNTGKKDSVSIVLYYDGKIRTLQTAQTGSVSSDGAFGPNVSADPAWFSWN